MYLFFRIEVAWEPAPPEAPAMASIGPLLQQRRFDEARPLLETLLQLQSEHPEALDNLGVLAGEEGRLEEARLLRRRVVVANAGDAHAQANAYVALGLAALRQEDRAEARRALEAAIELEPQNAFALPHSQDPARQLERTGPGLPDPRGHEAADAQ
ncbi:MAG: tetratricopeptide repeat protein [Synechococcaceae cyanobacterium]